MSQNAKCLALNYRQKFCNTSMWLGKQSLHSASLTHSSLTVSKVTQFDLAESVGVTQQPHRMNVPHSAG